jgi:hypothetical protein
MPFLGMRGNGDWVDNQRPRNWREMILYLYPNGRAPLTAITSMLRSEQVNDPHFHWWTKKLPAQKVDISGIFTDAALSTAYNNNNLGDDATVYIQGPEAQMMEFKVGHAALIRQSDNVNVDTFGKVTNRVLDGDNSYVAVKLREDTSSDDDITDADTLLAVGSINPEGGTLHEALAYNPVEMSNRTQIFTNSLSITRTAQRTRLRTGDQYQEAKRECLELHSIELEKAWIWGRQSSKIGENDKPERTTDGILSFIRKHAPQNISDFSQEDDSAYAGEAWTSAGELWLDNMLEQVFRHGKTEKLGLIGSGALLGIQRLARAGAQLNIEVGQTDYGIQVINWITPFGTISLKTHPLFSSEPTNRNSLLILEPDNLIYRFIDDTFFISDSEKLKNTHPYLDGVEEGYLTEAGLELHHPETFMFLNGLNRDNAQGGGG